METAYPLGNEKVPRGPPWRQDLDPLFYETHYGPLMARGRHTIHVRLLREYFGDPELLHPEGAPVQTVHLAPKELYERCKDAARPGPWLQDAWDRCHRKATATELPRSFGEGDIQWSEATFSELPAGVYFLWSTWAKSQDGQNLSERALIVDTVTILEDDRRNYGDPVYEALGVSYIGAPAIPLPKIQYDAAAPWQ